MRLSYRCEACKMANHITTKTTNRHDLLMELGTNEISEPCRFCNTLNTKHLNRLHAEINKPVIFIAFTATLIMALFLLFGYGSIIFLIFAIPVFVAFTQQKKASNFNKTMIK